MDTNIINTKNSNLGERISIDNDGPLHESLFSFLRRHYNIKIETSVKEELIKDDIYFQKGWEKE